MTPTTVTHQTMTHQVDQQMKMAVKMASIQLKVSAMHFTCAPMEFNSKINSVQRVLFSTVRSVIGQLLLTAPKLPPPQPPLLPPLLPPPQVPLPQLQQQLPQQQQPRLRPKLSKLQQQPQKNQQQPQPAPRSRFQIVIPRSLTLVAR